MVLAIAAFLTLDNLTRISEFLHFQFYHYHIKRAYNLRALPDLVDRQFSRAANIIALIISVTARPITIIALHRQYFLR